MSPETTVIAHGNLIHFGLLAIPLTTGCRIVVVWYFTASERRLAWVRVSVLALVSSWSWSVAGTPKACRRVSIPIGRNLSGAGIGMWLFSGISASRIGRPCLRVVSTGPSIRTKPSTPARVRKPLRSSSAAWSCTGPARTVCVTTVLSALTSGGMFNEPSRRTGPCWSRDDCMPWQVRVLC